MKYLIVSSIVCLSILSCNAQPDTGIQLPTTWSNDLVILLSHSGSMSGGRTHIAFSYDSIIYERSSGHEAAKRSYYVLKEADRNAILSKLRELKMERASSEGGMHAVMDGWSESVCIGSHCISGGPAYEMSEESRDIYHNAYSYLETFAMTKAVHKVKR